MFEIRSFLKIEIKKHSSKAWDTKGIPIKDAHFKREFTKENVTY